MTLRAGIGAALAGFVCVIGTGCSAAPEGAREDNGSTTEALPKCSIDGECLPIGGGLPRKPPVVNPGPPTSSFDGVAKAHSLGGTGTDPGWYAGDYHSNASGAYSVTGTDAFSMALRTLMQDGCSSPFYWEAWADHGGWHKDANNNVDLTPAQIAACQANPQWSCYSDKANAVWQLCPANSSATTYVQSLANANTMYTYSGSKGDEVGVTSDMLPHTAYGGTVNVPAAPSGWIWVALWEDPHGCGEGGCMCAM
jgi:hypothetical protein